MTSTKVNRSAAFVRRAGVGVALVLAGLLAHSAYGQEEMRELSLRATAVPGDAVVSLEGERLLLTGAPRSLSSDPLTIEISGPPEERSAILSIEEANVVLVLFSVSIQVQAGPAGQLQVSLPQQTAEGDGGWLDVYHSSGVPVEVRLPGGLVELDRGAARFAVNDVGVDIACAAGSVRIRREGQPPEVLDAGEQNRARLTPAGQIENLPRRGVPALEMSRARGRILHVSMLRELVSVAESVAEGDIQPPTEAAQAPALAVAPQVRLAEIVPRGGSTRATTTGRVSTPVLAQRSTAELFVRQGQPALAIVGARLERTRIIGNPGTASGGSALSVNRQAGTRFRLGSR